MDEEELLEVAGKFSCLWDDLQGLLRTLLFNLAGVVYYWVQSAPTTQEVTEL